MKRLFPTLLVLGLLVALFAAPALVARASGTAGTWTNTGSMNVGRYAHTATLLPNGQVLVAGGNSSGTTYEASAELYDPSTGTWTLTGSMNVARTVATATLLQSGEVLVAGGLSTSEITATAELYDPSTGTWTLTGSMNVARYFHTATLLQSGEVLVTGGDNNRGFTATAELYDPRTGTWTLTGSMNDARVEHTATLLQNGQVLVAGGFNGGAVLADAELYNPNAIDPTTGLLGTWTLTGSMNMGHENHTATLLQNGQVLVAGGYNRGNMATAELYDPSSGVWTFTGSMNVARSDHTATLLRNGQVLITGGCCGPFGEGMTLAELYDPSSGTWSLTGSMSQYRFVHTATLLQNGQVLVAGGDPPQAGAELYNSPGTNTSPVVQALPNATIAEGSAYTASGSFTDTGASNWTATVDYGDGSGVQSLPLSGASFTLNHTYAEEGSYTVTVTVTDNFGSTGTGTATVTVTNTPFTVSAITAPMTPTPVNTSISVSATFTDPGVLDTHTAVWTWGDGTTSPGAVTETNGSARCKPPIPTRRLGCIPSTSR